MNHEIPWEQQGLKLNPDIARNYRFYIPAYDNTGRVGTAFTQQEVDDLKERGKKVRKIKPQTIDGITYVGFESAPAVEIAHTRGYKPVQGLLIEH